MLKRIFLFGAISLVLVSCDVRKKDTQANLKGTEQPVINKDPTTVQIIDSAYNFGQVTEGDIVEYNYRFKNTGTKPLVITTTAASCGCTVPEKPEQPVLPGEIGFIKVKFNSEHRVGQTHKTVTVGSNAEPGFPELVLTGEVKEKSKE
ncbi:MAG: DUF1573 domain-containing protein [Ferruginibacter sp.]